MRKQEIFEDDPQLWRVNSAPFKARRLQMGLSIRACCAALNNRCGVETGPMKLWRCEEKAYFRVDADMKQAIIEVLRL
jgi:hypothetical protein